MDSREEVVDTGAGKPEPLPKALRWKLFVKAICLSGLGWLNGIPPGPVNPLSPPPPLPIPPIPNPLPAVLGGPELLPGLESPVPTLAVSSIINCRELGSVCWKWGVETKFTGGYSPV